MPQYPEIFVLRHGQTEWNAEGRHQGRLDSPLTAKGITQAEGQGKILGRQIADWSAFDIYCSPQGRAAHTAQIVLADTGREAIPDPRLCEVSFGAWEGLTRSEIEAQWPELADDQGDMLGWHFMAPGGESFEEMSLRVSAFLDDLQRPSIVIAHGITSRVIRGFWLGLDLLGMGTLGGGQGNVYHLKEGSQTHLEL